MKNEAYNETPTESSAMENPFAGLVDAAEERVTHNINLLGLQDTPQNRRAVAEQLYEIVKAKYAGVGGDQPFDVSMYMIALSTLRMQYARECIDLALQN